MIRACIKQVDFVGAKVTAKAHRMTGAAQAIGE
jgi:hypothetical protein